MTSSFPADGTHFITASHDRTSKLVDTQTLEVLKHYQGPANINGASISPLYDHVVLGGGQDAIDVRPSPCFAPHVTP